MINPKHIFGQPTLQGLGHYLDKLNTLKLKQSNISQEVCDRHSRLKILTAEGRTPPSAEYKESFPTGIPIP